MSKIFLPASHFHKTCCNKTKSRVAFLSHKYKTFHLILQEAPSAQLCIRYVLELGAVAHPKTANPAHMADNAKVDFSISSEGTEALKAMKHIETYGDSDVFPVFSGNPLS